MKRPHLFAPTRMPGPVGTAVLFSLTVLGNVLGFAIMVTLVAADEDSRAMGGLIAYGTAALLLPAAMAFRRWRMLGWKGWDAVRQGAVWSLTVNSAFVPLGLPILFVRL